MYRQLKLVYFPSKCAGILLNSYNTQWMAATPTLIGMWCYEYHQNFWLRPLSKTISETFQVPNAYKLVGGVSKAIKNILP